MTDLVKSWTLPEWGSPFLARLWCLLQGPRYYSDFLKGPETLGAAPPEVLRACEAGAPKWQATIVYGSLSRKVGRQFYSFVPDEDWALVPRKALEAPGVKLILGPAALALLFWFFNEGNQPGATRVMAQVELADWGFVPARRLPWTWIPPPSFFVSDLHASAMGTRVPRSLYRATPFHPHLTSVHGARKADRVQGGAGDEDAQA